MRVQGQPRVSRYAPSLVCVVTLDSSVSLSLYLRRPPLPIVRPRVLPEVSRYEGERHVESGSELRCVPATARPGSTERLRRTGAAPALRVIQRVESPHLSLPAGRDMLGVHGGVRELDT